MPKKPSADNNIRLRVYQVAQQLDMSGKELVKKLQEMGYAIKSVQNTLSEEEAGELALKLSQSNKKKTTKSKKKSTAKSASKTQSSEKKEDKKSTAKSTSKTKKKASKESINSDVDAKPKKTSKATKSKTTAKAPIAQKEVVTEVEEIKAPKAEEIKTSEAKVDVEQENVSSSEETKTSQEYMHDFVLKIMQDYFEPSAKVELRNATKNSQKLVVTSEKNIDIPNKRDVFDAIRYLLGKFDTYHFEGKIRYSLYWDAVSQEPTKEVVEKIKPKEEKKEKKEEDSSFTSLQSATLQASMNLKGTKKALVISRLSAKERREIHMILAEQKDPKFRTFSDGEGIFRRLVIGAVSPK